jgi:hypothetical protein
VGGASAVLTRSLGGARSAGFAALLGALAIFYGTAPWLPDLSLWWDVGFIAVVLFPAVFGLVWFVLPLRVARESRLIAVGLAAAVIAAVLEVVDQTAIASFFKLAATTALAFWFLRYFENVLWVALVAVLIQAVDIWSVFRGPTSHLIKHPGGVSALSFAFRFPGEHNAATLGVPDLFFFALFLAAAARWQLRVALTWVLMIALLGLTIVLTVWLDEPGLPALPALSAGFLLANADRIWRAARDARARTG